MKNNTIETMIGAVVLLTACFFLTFAYNRSGYQTDRDHKSYTATFDRVDGLTIGSDVKISGVKVGVVQSMAINPQTYLAEVTFTVADTLSLPGDSSAEINTDGLLGGKYLALVPGGADEMLKPGDAITHTQSSVSLEGLIGQFIFGKGQDQGTQNNPANTPNHGDPK